MNKILQCVAPVALSFVLASCAVTSKDTVMTTEKRTGGFLGLSTTSDVEIETPKAFAGAQRVVIGGFKVGFNQSKKLKKQARGRFSGGFGGNSTGLVKLDGISAEAHQRVTDQ